MNGVGRVGVGGSVGVIFLLPIFFLFFDNEKKDDVEVDHPWFPMLLIMLCCLFLLFGSYIHLWFYLECCDFHEIFTNLQA